MALPVIAASAWLLMAQALAGHHLNGTWKLDVVLGDSQGGTATVVLNEIGNGALEGSYSGAVGADLPVSGRVDGAHVEFGFESAIGRVSFDGTYEDGELSGTTDYGMGGRGTFNGSMAP